MGGDAPEYGAVGTPFASSLKTGWFCSGMGGLAPEFGAIFTTKLRSFYHFGWFCSGIILRFNHPNFGWSCSGACTIPQKGLEYHSVDIPSAQDLVLVGYYKTEQWDAIVKNHLYYVPAAFGRGSINLVYGFEKTKYLLLHHGKHRILVRLKGDGPKFYPKKALQDKGFTPTDEYYICFEIKNFDPVPNIVPYIYELERKGAAVTTPYFTTIDKFI